MRCPLHSLNLNLQSTFMQPFLMLLMREVKTGCWPLPYPVFSCQTVSQINQNLLNSLKHFDNLYHLKTHFYQSQIHAVFILIANLFTAIRLIPLMRLASFTRLNCII
jgi:hypothetical protein